jgi:hypothetical protein
MRTPPRADPLHPSDYAPSQTGHLFSSRFFELLPGYSTIRSSDLFENDDPPTIIRPSRKRSIDAFLESLRSPPPITSPNVTSFFTCPNYNRNEPETWPILYLPYHITPGASVPTHIGEMLCHVHYKGAGAMALHSLLTREMEMVQTEDEKEAIEFSAYMTWPYNCTRDGWRVYSGMRDFEVLEWKEAVRKWHEEQGRRAEMDIMEHGLGSIRLGETTDETNGGEGGRNDMNKERRDAEEEYERHGV